MVLANPALASSGGGVVSSKKGHGLGALKRSHSVKSNFPVRKTSWGGTKAIGMYADNDEGIDNDDDEDKENSILDEADEDAEEGSSETGTERRTSYTGTSSFADSLGYTDGGSSIMSSSNDRRRPSYTTSTVGTVGTRDLPLTEEESEDEEEEEDHNDHALSQQQQQQQQEYELHHEDLMAPKGEIGNAAEMVVFEGAGGGAEGHHGSDSGIGTDIPTAQLEGGSDYFPTTITTKEK